MIIDARAVTRGVVVGLIVIVPISIGVKILRDHVDLDSAWLAIPFVAILLAYVFAGFVAGDAAPDGPLSNGALAALVSVGGYRIVRLVVPLVLGDNIDIAAKSIVVNAILALAFGMFGGALTSRDTRSESNEANPGS